MPDAEPVTRPDTDAELALASLRADLNRAGSFPADNEYLSGLLAAARQWLALSGVRDDGSPLYLQILVGRAAYIYRKRVTGEAEPVYLRRMIHDFKLSERRDT